jgi:hypothetical protein
MLTLYEELYLLALDEEKGNLFSFARKFFVYPLAGAILAELALLGKVGVGEKLRLVVSEAEPTGDPIFDGALEQIRVSERARKPSYWVSLFSEEPKKLRQNVAERLVEKNVLVQDEKRFFRQEPISGSESSVPDKFKIKHELRALILSNGESNLHNLALLEMIAAGGLLGLVFTQDELETADQVIHKKFLIAALENPIMQLVEEIGQAVSSVQADELDS